MGWCIVGGKSRSGTQKVLLRLARSVLGPAALSPRNEITHLNCASSLESRWDHPTGIEPLSYDSLGNARLATNVTMVEAMLPRRESLCATGGDGASLCHRHHEGSGQRARKCTARESKSSQDGS